MCQILAASKVVTPGNGESGVGGVEDLFGIFKDVVLDEELGAVARVDAVRGRVEKVVVDVARAEAI